MASIVKEFTLAAGVEQVWDALADFGALHTRLVPGFVTDTKLDGDTRIVTFANGSVTREQRSPSTPGTAASPTSSRATA